MTVRPRSATGTRAEILSAARAQFARDGYDRTTIRSVAEAVGVDPTLVMRYFVNKDGLFAEAARFELQLPDLIGLGPADIARALVDRFFEIFEESGTFLALLRAAATSDTIAARMREVLIERAAPALAKVAVDQPDERAALVGSQILGFAFARYVLAVPALANMTREQVLRWLGPTLVHYLTAPNPGYPPRAPL